MLIVYIRILLVVIATGYLTQTAITDLRSMTLYSWMLVYMGATGAFLIGNIFVSGFCPEIVGRGKWRLSIPLTSAFLGVHTALYGICKDVATQVDEEHFFSFWWAIELLALYSLAHLVFRWYTRFYAPQQVGSTH